MQDIVCNYCKHNKIDREKFKKLLWKEEHNVQSILDFASIGTYINGNSLVSLYFDDGIYIEQDETKIICCPICGKLFN